MASKNAGSTSAAGNEAEEEDFALTYFRKMPCWTRPPQRAVSDRPFIPSWEGSYTMKYLNYETEPGYVNLDNPLQMLEEFEVARRNATHKPKKPKKEDFSVTQEGITEVQKKATSQSGKSGHKMLIERT